MSDFDKLAGVVQDLLKDYGHHLPQEAKDKLKEAGIDTTGDQLLGLLFDTEEKFSSAQEAQAFYERLKRDFSLNVELSRFGLSWAKDPDSDGEVDGWIVMSKEGEDVFLPDDLQTTA